MRDKSKDISTVHLGETLAKWWTLDIVWNRNLQFNKMSEHFRIPNHACIRFTIYWYKDSNSKHNLPFALFAPNAPNEFNDL